MKAVTAIIFSIFFALYVYHQAVFPQNLNAPIEGNTAQTVEIEAANYEKQWNKDSINKAIELFSKARLIYVSEKNIDKSLFCLAETARLYSIIGDKDKAFDIFLTLHKTSKENNNLKYQVISLSELSLLELEIGNLNKSKKHFDEAEVIGQKAENLSAGGIFFFSKAEYFYYQRNLEEAIENYQAAAGLARNDGNLKDEAKYLLYLGYAYLANGEPIEGLKVLENSLAKRQMINDKRGQALTYIAIGHISNYIDEKQSALAAYYNAERLFADDIDFVEKARLFNGIGKVYEDFGDWQTSLNYRKKALELFGKSSHSFGQLATLPTLAMLSNRIGDEESALIYFDQARSLTRQLNDKYFSAFIDEELGDFYYQKSLFDQAFLHYTKALNYFAKNNVKKEIPIIQTKLAQIFGKRGEYSFSRQYLLSSLKLNREIKNKFAESDVFYQLSKVDFEKDKFETALESAGNSISAAEGLSSDILDSKLKSIYFSNISDRYELYIKLLMKRHRQLPDKGYDIQSLQAAEKSRARSMLEKLSLAEANFNKDADPETVKREKEIRNLLNAKTDKLTDALSSRAEKSEIDKISNEINELTNELEQIKADLKQNSPIYSAIKNPAPFDVADFQNRVLDEKTLLLEFSFGNDESYLWLIGKNYVESYVLPPRQQIETRVETLRKLIDSRAMVEGETIENYQSRIAAAEIEYEREAQVFSNELLGQVADKLSNKRLIIVPDGKLHYFPVAALPRPNSTDNQPILLTNEVVYEPSAATLALLMRNGLKTSAATKNLLVFSDPIFSNQDVRVANDGNANEFQPDDNSLKVEKFRFAESLTSLVRLNASKDEADSIVDIVGADESTTLSGAAATRERALDASIGDYKIVHFATHGLIKEDRPELSGIVLSQVDEGGQSLNGVIRLQDIYAMNLSADAVILSACSTGIGKEVKGEGLMSLNNAFLQTGAKSVVSSLWKVDDYAAQELMKNFYREMATGNVTTSEALRRAQIRLRENPQYQSPFYWAAFTIQGDYKTIPQISRRFDRRLFGLLIIPFALLGIYFYRRRLN